MPNKTCVTKQFNPELRECVEQPTNNVVYIDVPAKRSKRGNENDVFLNGDRTTNLNYDWQDHKVSGPRFAAAAAVPVASVAAEVDAVDAAEIDAVAAAASENESGAVETAAEQLKEYAWHDCSDNTADQLQKRKNSS
ncbi:hypothetical protein L484_000063 [Morus notabilis]|uniref:Uncharacterized protein n=1 Tax=Morus notabilis TaxID=981085 RepID=W9SMY9_9ROSA|nr:hypothetical protein L484_000063 [Morus notabilis]